MRNTASSYCRKCPQKERKKETAFQSPETRSPPLNGAKLSMIPALYHLPFTRVSLSLIRNAVVLATAHKYGSAAAEPGHGVQVQVVHAARLLGAALPLHLTRHSSIHGLVFFTEILLC